MTTTHKRILKTFLLLSGALIFLIVIIGGVTRLTNSGLSMVEWKPISGIFYPTNTYEWTQLFNDYKAFPEYKNLNSGMTLSEFKVIFFWEFLHRQLGRLLGLLLLVPILYLLYLKQITTWVGSRFFCIFVLVCLQGALGWYMVKSGLLNKPYVSHLRLAAHLSLAFFTLQYIWWTYLDLKYKKHKTQNQLNKFDILVYLFYYP